MEFNFNSDFDFDDIDYEEITPLDDLSQAQYFDFTLFSKSGYGDANPMKENKINKGRIRHNVITDEHGNVYASEIEYAYATQVLYPMLISGEITNLQMQTQFMVISTPCIKGTKVKGLQLTAPTYYTPDFTYIRASDGMKVAVELKGWKFEQDAKMRIKLFLEKFPEYEFHLVYGSKKGGKRNPYFEFDPYVVPITQRVSVNAKYANKALNGDKETRRL